MATKNTVKETYLQKEKRGLQEKLFNTEILSRPDVSTSELAEIAGANRTQLYRWLKKFGFDAKDGFKNDKTPEEIQDIVWSTLTCAQAEQLYDWAKSKRFAEKKVPSTRAYHLTAKGLKGRKENRKRTTADEHNDEAKNAELVKNAGIPTIEDVPTATTAKAKNDTIENRLHDFITTNSTTEQQVENLLNNLLFGEPAKTEAVHAMADKARNTNDFNVQQWAFQTLYSRCNRQATTDFEQVLSGLKQEQEVEGRQATEFLLKAYRQNKAKIDLNEIK